MRRILAGRYPSPSPGAKLITNHHASCSDEQPIGASSIVNRINQPLPLFSGQYKASLFFNITPPLSRIKIAGLQRRLFKRLQ